MSSWQTREAGRPALTSQALARIILSVVNSKKKPPHQPPPSGEIQVIRLRPSTTDYATFVRTTSQVLGDTGPASRKTKPNARLLWLMNLES